MLPRLHCFDEIVNAINITPHSQNSPDTQFAHGGARMSGRKTAANQHNSPDSHWRNLISPADNIFCLAAQAPDEVGSGRKFCVNCACVDLTEMSIPRKLAQGAIPANSSPQIDIPKGPESRRGHPARRAQGYHQYK